MPDVEFLGKLLEKIDKIDRQSLQTHLQDMQNEKEFFRHMLDSIPAGVMIIGTDERVKFMSRGAKTLLGVSHSVGGRSLPLREVIKDRELADFLSAHLSRRDHVVQHELEVLVPAHAYLMVSASPLFDQWEKHQGCLVLLVNTTFSHERERQARRLQKFDSLTRLAAGIAHEIGNPLNSIGIHLKLLQREMESVPASSRKKWMELVEIIRSETRRLDRMVRNFLTATRRPPSRFKEEDINEVLEAAATLLRPEMHQGRVRLHMRLDRNLSPFLMDAAKMRQVFLNIIRNAVQSMPNGGKLEIVSSRRDKVCSVVFRDEGVGISEEGLPHIFEAYYTTKKEGSGLGLMIVYQIIQDHGGRVEVKSKRGKGTTFTLYVPMRMQKLQLPERTMKVGS